MRNFQDTFETSKRLFISVFSVYMALPLNFLFNNFNTFQPSLSVLIGKLNAKYSKLCSTDNNNKSGITLDNITSTSGYNHMIIQQLILQTTLRCLLI